jgi:hypothetical protein
MPPDDQLSSRRRALLVATGRYGDPALAALRAPTGDVAALAAVLGDAEVGGFEVQQLIDRPTEELRQEIETFFDQGRPHDLLLLYVSGHGVLSQSRRFYFATATTSMQLLRSTAIEDSFVNDVMQGSRARSIVLMLDCCHSGAFGKGLAPKSATTVDVEHRFEGQGRVTLSASTELEYAFEETEVNALDPAAPGSLFTRSVVEGLRSGDADLDEDGRISVDDLYDYVCRRVRERSVHQTPGMAGDIRGEITIARSRRGAQLPPELAAAADSNLAGIREGAVGELATLAAGTGGLATAARAALERLADDDSRRVAAAAQAALGRAEPAAPPPAPPPAAPPSAPPEPSEPAPGRPVPPWWVIAAVVACLAVVAGVVIAVSGGGKPAGPAVAAPYVFSKDSSATLVVGVPNGAGAGNEGTPGIVLSGATDSPTVFTGSDAGVPGKAEPDQRFGAAIASADFDKDGLADLAIGVPGKSGVAILYGLDVRKQWIGASDIEHKPELKDFGASLVAADFNHDGFGDLAVSAPGDSDQRNAWDWGSIHILFGGSSGLGTTNDTVIPQRKDFKEFGFVMAAGDIDHDGNVDLLEGGPGNPGGDGGHLSVCEGGPKGPTACAVRLSATTSLAVGRINDDPFADVVQGDAGAADGAGELRVWLGQEKAGLSGDPVRIDQKTPRVPGDRVADNAFGSAVAAGELTGDHFDDIVVSALNDNGGAGTVSLIPGSRDGSRPEDAIPLTASGIESGHFGAPLSVFDWDSDDHADVFVGVTGAKNLDDALVYYVSKSEGGLDLEAQHAVGLDKVTQLNATPKLYIGR